MPQSYTIYMERLLGLLQPRFVMQDPSLLASSEKDYAYCLRRFKGEGIRFLTVTLPELRKAVDLSFKTGKFECPKSFAVAKGKAFPSFLSSHFCEIYDDDGLLSPIPDIERIAHVRQVLEAFYKLQVPYSPATEAETLENFVMNENRVRMFLNDEAMWEKPHNALINGASLLCRRVFRGFDPRDIIPRNGPGKLATGEMGDDKWQTTTIVNQIHRKFPYWKFNYHSPGMLVDLKDEYARLPRVESQRSQVKLVPKDSRGPRIITMEPHGYMWIQQGLGSKMARHLERRSALTRGHINFTDQTVNQSIALNSSLSGEWATLDLKDASDLLSDQLVKLIFRLKPEICESLFAVRTAETVLPDGQVIRLKKFAGMGSAICFPVESFCFWAICVSALTLELGINLYEASRFVYVYGDDIICPTELAETVIVALESVGLKVNTSKSYYSGTFRESCGVDAYLGKDVTPIRFKKLFPADRSDGEAFAAWCAYGNALYRKGYHSLANTIFKDLGKVFGKVPYGRSTSSYPCRIVDDPAEAEALNKANKIRWRVGGRYQRMEFKVKRLAPLGKPTTLDGWARLTRNLVAGTGDEPSIVVLPHMVKIVRGWTAV